MNFAFNPQDGRPARLVRFVDKLPVGWLALYDHAQNLVTIDRDQFDALPEYEREQIMRTHVSVESYRDWPPSEMREAAE